jgi:hypothetical protein
MHKPVYYEVLGNLRSAAEAKFGKKMTFSHAEVAELMGVSRATVYRRNYPFKSGRITLEALAEKLV